MELIKLFLKFSVVGLFGVVVNLLVYSLLLHFGAYYLYAAIVSFIVAATNNFYWNFIWTFKNRGHKSPVRKYINFFIISLVNFGVNLIILKLMHEGFGFNELISQVIAIGLASVLNFVGNYLITFKEKSEG